MKTIRRGRIPALLLPLLLGVSGSAAADEYYLRPVVVQREADLLAEDFLLPGSGAAADGSSLTAPSLHPALVPSKQLRELLMPLLEDSAPVLVGRRIGFVPAAWSGVAWLPDLLGSVGRMLPDESCRVELLLPDPLPAPLAAARAPQFEREAGSLREGRIRFRWADPEAGSGRLLVSIREFLPGAEAGRALSAGAELAPGDIRIGWTERSAGAEAPFVPEPGVRYRLVRSLVTGAAIPASAVREIPDVRAGEAVSLRFRRGFISIEMTGKTLASGRIGQTIPVVASSTGRRFRGVLSAGREVEIGIE